MSQRDSGYARIERDNYETPAWVTHALVPHLPRCTVWEPAAGSGKMANALLNAGFDVVASDITGGHDFLTVPPLKPFRAIITNPPYELATQFIERALALMPQDGIVAMLLRCDFDHAITRQHLFADCTAFAMKLVLTTRIRWFEDSCGSPSFNHAWFVWHCPHSGPAVLAYAHKGEAQ
jgi:hypothetical protein